MKTIAADNELDSIAPAGVLTIGNFDGVHLGHQQIMARAARFAAERGVKLTAMTFEPHPIAVLRPDLTPGVLTPLPLKAHLLATHGADYLYVAKASRELLGLSPEDFVRRFITENIHPAVVIEGHDFSFGAKRAGNVDVLAQLGHKLGFEVVVAEPELIDLPHTPGVRVSSTVIREALQSGRVDEAAAALGRPYRLMGPIVPGKGKGRQLGFPTANLQPLPQIVPDQGVYVGYAEIADSLDQLCASTQRRHAVFSIGQTETFGQDQPLLLEAHLLKNNLGPLTDKYLAMDFIKKLRDQRKFNSESDLANQIEKDCQQAESLLEP